MNYVNDEEDGWRIFNMKEEHRVRIRYCKKNKNLGIFKKKEISQKF